jgi:hypothetical protein
MPFTLAILAVVLCWTWFFEQRAPGHVVIGVGLAVLGLTAWHDARRREWGLDWRALGPGLARVLIVTLPAVVIILVAGAALGTLHDRRDFLGSLGAPRLGDLPSRCRNGGGAKRSAATSRRSVRIAAAIRGHPPAESVSR